MMTKNYIKFSILVIFSIIFLSGNVHSQTPVSPSNGETGVKRNTDAYPTWSPFTVDIFNGPYDFQIDDDADFSSLVAGSDGIPDTLAYWIGLPNTTYYWRVRDTFFNASLELLNGPWHEYSYTMELATPILIQPDNSIITFTDPIDLTWRMFANFSNVDFTVTVALDNSFTTGVIAKTVSSNDSYISGSGEYFKTQISLPVADTYYWKVKAEVIGSAPNAGETKTSNTFNFTLQLANPPSLLSPSDGTTGVSIEPTLTWSSVPGASSYKLYIDDDNTFASPIYSSNEGTNLSKALTELDTNIPLDNGKTYYWKVAALDGNDIEYTSDVWEFRTTDPIPINLVYPQSGTVYAYSPLMFIWSLNQYVTGVNFYLQVLKQNTAPVPADWLNASLYNAGSNIYYSLNLSEGSKYFWRIIAKNNNDEILDYSSEAEFMTSGGAVTAYPAWPIGENIVYSLTPSFHWYTQQYTSSATYEVYYSTSGANTNGILDSYTSISAGTNLFVSAATALSPSQDYYWQVKTTYGAEVKYSSIEEFTTYGAPGLVPTEATPSYPASGVTIYTQSPTFYWYTEGYNTDINFTVEVDDDPTFGSIDFIFGTTQNTYIQGTGLLPGTTYHWRVKSAKSGYSTITGPTATFTVAGGSGSNVVLSYPVGNPTVWSVTPTLTWYLNGSSTGWNNYVVRWKAGGSAANWGDGGDWDGEYKTANMNEMFYTFTSALSYGETYYWAVALNEGTAITDADFIESSFTIAGGSAAVGQTYPANNSTGVTNNPTFYWYVTTSSLGVDKFMVEYSKTELFTEFIDSIETTGTYASPSSSLEAGATYWWRVYVSYDAGSTWNLASSKWSFTIDAGASSVMPLVGSPTNGQTVPANNLELSWYLPAQSTSILSYELELSNNSEFTDPEVYDNISQLNTKINGLNNGEYFWRVRSTSSNNTISSYSNVANFKVEDGVTGVDENDEAPLTYELLQNYPNPFNPSTTIRFSIPEASNVSLKIYNSLGQEIKTLVNEQLSAGSYNINFNGEDLSSGIYFYRIETNNFTATKKLMLVK